MHPPITSEAAVHGKISTPGGPIGNAPGQVDALNARLEARYGLYTGGRRKAGEAIARAGVRQAEAKRAAALLELEAALARGYFAVREAEAREKALAAAIAALDESFRHARLREEAGAAHSTVVLDIEATRAERVQQRLAVAHARSSELRRLAFLVALPASSELALAEPDATPEPWSTEPTDLSQHPLRLAAEFERSEAEAQTAAARSGHRPSVEAFARYQYDRGWRREGEGDSWLAGVAVSLPLFDGFATHSQVRAGLAGERIAEVQLESIVSDLKTRLREAEASHALAEANLTAARARHAAARASVELTRARFAADAVESTALLAAEARLTEAAMAESQAELQLQLALAQLRLASGQHLFSPFTNEGS